MFGEKDREGKERETKESKGKAKKHPCYSLAETNLFLVTKRHLLPGPLQKGHWII